MSKEALFENTEKHLKAIDQCIDCHLRMPALILIYAGIDIFASLARPKPKKKVTRQDYIEWCEKYILATGKFLCTGIDFYAARCSIVHTYTMESQLSEDGKANEIIYAWGNRKPEDLQEVIDRAGLSPIVIHVETLAAEFREGVAMFFSELDNDEEKARLVLDRAGKLFMDQKDEFWR